MIFVKKSLFNNASELIEQITSPISKFVTSYSLYKVLNELKSWFKNCLSKFKSP